MRDDAFTSPEERETVARLERGLARVKPPDDLFERIRADVRPPATLRPLRRMHVRALPVTLGSAALAAAAAVAITLAVTNGGGLGDPAVRAALSGSQVSGTAAVYRPDRPDALVVLDLSRVPSPPPAHYYAVWVIRRGSAQSVAIGSFSPRGDTTRVELRLPGPGDYASLDISVEEIGGSPERSNQTLASASLEPDS